MKAKRITNIMKDTFYFQSIPRSRIATFDTFSVGLQKHHVNALLEFDVTESRKKIYDLRKEGYSISFNAWLIKIISSSLQKHPEASAYLYNKRKLLIFNDINISILVEKIINNKKVPIPVVLKRVQNKTLQEITEEIKNAKDQQISRSDFVINKNTTPVERVYYYLPGWFRRMVWKIMLRNPKYVFKRMGNSVITSIGMVGRINGWFIHKSIHPISFGVGSVIKKPAVVNNEIKIREILNMTILVDHDVIDGAPMVRFLNDLTKDIETGAFLNSTGV